MADPEQARPAEVGTDASAEPQVRYDGFISYTSGPDGSVARRTKNYLERFHRQWLLRRLKLRALTICMDATNFRVRHGETIEPVKATLERYVVPARHLIVFCSPAAARSDFVEFEIRSFLEAHSPSAVLPVVVRGDPVNNAAHVFPRALIEKGYDKAVWLDFRGSGMWWWQRRGLRVRPFREERVKLATELHDRSPGIVPAWKRAEAIRRRLVVAACLIVMATASAAAWQANRNIARSAADEVLREVRDGGASIADLQARAVLAAARFHEIKVDEAYRRAASLTIHRRGRAGHSLRGRHALAVDSAAAARLSDRGLEVTDAVHDGNWRPLVQGRFSDLAISDDRQAFVLVDADGVQTWRNGMARRCSGTAAAVVRAVTIDATGIRVAALFESATGWTIGIADANDCDSRPFTISPAWTVSASAANGGLLQTASGSTVSRVVLNHDASALIASSGESWLLARIEPGGRLEPLNQGLAAAWRASLPDRETSGRTVQFVVSDAAFSADGRYAAVAAARVDGVAAPLQPVALLFPVRNGETPIDIAGSRGARRLALARTSPVVAFAVADTVRLWDWARNAPLGSFKVPASGAGVAAMAFATTDRLLLVANAALQREIYALDARTATQLDKASVGDVPVIRIVTGGPAGMTALVDTAADAVLYELRALDVLARLPKGGERMWTATLLTGGGVAASGASRTLRVVASDGSASAIPLGDAASQVVASNESVVVLQGNRRLARCSRASWICSDHAAPDPRAQSIGIDRAGALFFGCSNGAIVADGQACGERATTQDSRAVTALAVSAKSVLRVADAAACVSSRTDLESCDPLPTGNDRVSTAAVSSDGAYAATVAGTKINIYRRGFHLRFPWPSQDYELQSQIATAGDVLAVAFSDDASWIRAAMVWNTEVVVQCFPVTAAAMRRETQQVPCGDDTAR